MIFPRTPSSCASTSIVALSVSCGRGRPLSAEHAARTLAAAGRVRAGVYVRSRAARRPRRTPPPPSFSTTRSRPRSSWATLPAWRTSRPHSGPRSNVPLAGHLSVASRTQDGEVQAYSGAARRHAGWPWERGGGRAWRRGRSRTIGDRTPSVTETSSGRCRRAAVAGAWHASGARHPFHVRAEDALQSASEAPPPSSHSMCFSGQTPSVDDGRRSKRPFAALCVHSPATEQVGGCALPSSRRGRRGDVGRHVPGARDAGRHQTRPRVRILCTLLPSAIMNSSS